MPPAAVTSVPLDQLHPATWNPRLVTDDRFQALCRSLAADPEFLWRRPVLAMADGTIYAGNTRYRAAQHLGWHTVPAVLEDVDERTAKERALRDNNAAGTWEEHALADLVADIQLGESDLDLVGFDPKDLNDLLASMVPLNAIDDPGADDDDPLHLAKAWATASGQLWDIPSRSRTDIRHQLLIGDATNPHDVERLLAGRADAVVTDPPYDLSPARVRLALRLAADRAVVLSGGKQVFSLAGEDWHYAGDSVWLHRSRLIARSKYLPLYAHSNILFLRRADAKLGWERPAPTTNTVVSIEGADYTPGEHGHAKATGLFEAMIAGFTAVSHWADPFAGTGPTLLAAENRGRRWSGMEISPTYAAAALERWKTAGLAPRLAS